MLCVLVSLTLTLLTPVTKIPDGVVIGFRIFAWAPNSHKYYDSNQQQKIVDPTYPIFPLTLIQRYMQFPSLYNIFTYIFSLISRLSNGSKHCWILISGSSFRKFSKISGYGQELVVVCVFCLIKLAYLAKNFRTCARIACGLWFFTFEYLLTCPRNPKFQDSCKKSV